MGIFCKNIKSKHDLQILKHWVRELNKLVDQIDPKRLAEVGEMGLDLFHARTQDCYSCQKEGFKYIWDNLSSKARALQFVLHVRGSVAGDMRAAEDTIEILKAAKIPLAHPLYRHAYHGGVEECKKWLKAYTNSSFFPGARTTLPLLTSNRRLPP